MATATATTATTAPTTIEFALREPGDAFAIARATPRAGALGEAEAAAARDAGATRASDGAWTAPASAVRAIRDALVRRTNARVLDVPGMALRCAEVRFEEDAAGAYARGVPKALDAKMFEFQRTGVMYALRRRGRVLIGDEMGLGKTVQACALLACYREECPALILVPTSLREAWRNALQSWLDVADGDVACGMLLRACEMLTDDVRMIIFTRRPTRRVARRTRGTIGRARTRRFARRRTGRRRCGRSSTR